MSKNVKRLLVLVLSFLTLFVVTIFGIACTDGNDSESGSWSGDSIDAQTPIVKSYNWNGLKNFNLKITDTDYSYDEVSVTDEDGLQYELTVDDSAVNYGEKGEYTVKFTIDDQTKEQKVKIYDLPQISVDGTLSFTYEQVMNKSSIDGLFATVTAKDCFGLEIPVGVKESQTTVSFYRQDGSVDYGEYTVTLATVDASGQTVEKDLTITVERNEINEPVLAGGDIVADVVDERKDLSLSLKNREVIAISLNGVLIGNESLIVNEDGVITALDLTNVDVLELGDDNVIRVITSGGYTEKTITFTDEKEAVMDVSGRENQTIILGDEPTIIQPKKVYPKQNFDIEFSMVSPSGESIDTTQATFEADEIGVYVLTATAKRNGVKCGEVTVNYNVHQAYNSFKTEQERNKVHSYKDVLWAKSIRSGEIQYEQNKTLGDRIGNYLSFTFTSASYLGFHIPTSLSLSDIENLKEQGVEEVFVNMYADSLYKKAIRWMLIEKGCDDDDGQRTEAEIVGAGATLEPKTWTRISVDIDYIIENYTALQNGEMLFFHIYNGGDGLDVHENFKVYFSEILFTLPLAEVKLAEDEFNSFANARYLNKAEVYRDINNATPAVSGVALSWESGEVGGVDGNFAKVNIGVYSNGSNQVAPAHVGVKFPMLKTLQEIQALKNSGYTSLEVPMYIDCTENKKVMGKIFTVGASSSSVSWFDLPSQTWTTFTISIDELIENYTGLVNGTKILLPILNSGAAGEKNQAYFNVYYGAMKFIKTVNTTYNNCMSTADVKAYYGCTDIAWETSTANLVMHQHSNETVGNRTGNFLSVQFTLKDGWARSNVGITIAPSVTKTQLEALKAAGYTKLSVDYYFNNNGGTDVGFKYVCVGDVYTYGATTPNHESKEHAVWHTFTVDIDKIIENYEGLANGTKYLMKITCYSAYGDSAVNAHFSVYFGNMQFIKDN